ncbi:four helix bundle protein [Aliinostoc sp. HNIBRCY26]|uniref:four helix bundle protein n=1 Tax=Aliinostoc sp. HNIBRCY26 TaxID=3418997 RepID=UPI003D02BADE
MGKVERFEDLIAWQKARILTQDIYQVTQQGKFAKDFGLSGQIQRAAVSIMSNIAECFERSHLGEFHQFLAIAKSSCAELRSQLYVALDIHYLDQLKFHQLLTQAEELGRIIGGLRFSVARKKQQKAQ